MAQQETKHFVKRVDLSAVSLVGRCCGGLADLSAVSLADATLHSRLMRDFHVSG